MTWYIIAALALIILLFIRLSKARGMPILSVSIITNDGLKFSIKFKKLHEDVKSIEYLRLTLSFITKMYYVSRGSKEDNRTLIRLFLQRMSESQNLLDGLAEFKNHAILSDSLSNTKDTKEIVGILLYKDIKTRYINTKLPLSWYPNQFYDSIIVLTIACETYLDDYQKAVLHKALKNLAKAYYSSDDTESLQASFVLPNKAFIEATFEH